MKRQDALSLSEDGLLNALATSRDGLPESTAHARLLEHGRNALSTRGPHPFTIFLRQFQSSLIYLLIAACAIAYSIGDRTDGTIILAILLINTLLGFAQEYRSERVVEKLSKLITKEARVIRGGQARILPESDVVPGDIVTVREGDIVPADMRLLQSDALSVDESMLSGESASIPKSAAPEENTAPGCLLFAGTIVEKGLGTGVAYATGAETEFGEIAKLSAETFKETRYEQSLRSFSSIVIRIVFAGLALVFIAKLLFTSHMPEIDTMMLFIIALAVSTVPEALPVIATVTLSRGALLLSKKHVIVKRLSAVEDIGDVNVLCTDKTGTITENRMSVKRITAMDKNLFEALALATTELPAGKKRHMKNTYAEAFDASASLATRQRAKQLSMVKELPFDPEARRSRAILHDTESGAHMLVAVGAPESLFLISRAHDKPGYAKIIEQEGLQGLHHIAIAYKEITYHDGFDIAQNEHDLRFLGFASLEDPLRESAAVTILRAEKLGIAIKILTGDSKEVAQYIGTKVGLVKEGDHVYVGSELDALSPKEFEDAVRRTHVFARVSPTQKFRIIEELKKHHVVAYQGDGINDAPSLRLADVSIAVDSATDIAKASADIILLHRSLDVIVDGIHYGRAIFVNIDKYIRYTMVNNFGIFVALSFLFLFSADLPVLPVQMLLNNLLGDIPLITVGTDSVEDEAVARPKKHDSKRLIMSSLALGIPTALFELAYFATLRSQPLPAAQTSLYVFFTLQALIAFFAIRSEKHFWKGTWPSRAVATSFTLAFILAIGIVYSPYFAPWFSFVPLSWGALGIIAIFIVFYFFTIDAMHVRFKRAYARS
ncbi:MAG TPA: cation-transporting P-type ATPase [Candidatus Paceibacterota bacterium]